MLKAWEHFKTITKHRHQVIKHCYKAGILFQGLFHDLSKYSPEEFIVGAQYYTGTRSPNEGERAEKGYSKAWMHHKGRNSININLNRLRGRCTLQLGRNHLSCYTWTRKDPSTIRTRSAVRR